METDEKLLKFDTCLISDALDKLEEKGVLTGIFSCTLGLRLAGKVITLKLKSKKVTHKKVHLGAALIDSSSKGDVIIIEYNNNVPAGTWGGLLTASAIKKGIKGVVSQGFVRDIDYCRKNFFPVFAAGVTAVSARNRIFEESYNQTIHISEVEINPGDYVLADDNGVVIIKKELTEEVISTAEKLQVRENELLTLINKGHKISSVLDNKYEDLLNNE